MHEYYRLAIWSAQWDIRIHFGVNSEGECLDHVFADAVWAIMVIELIRNVGGDQFGEVDGGVPTPREALLVLHDHLLGHHRDELQALAVVVPDLVDVPALEF